MSNTFSSETMRHSSGTLAPFVARGSHSLQDGAASSFLAPLAPVCAWAGALINNIIAVRQKSIFIHTSAGRIRSMSLDDATNHHLVSLTIMDCLRRLQGELCSVESGNFFCALVLCDSYSDTHK